MTLKILLQFESGKTGWSEVYYAVGTDPISFLNQVAAGTIIPGNPADFIGTRRNLLTPQARIARIRVSVEGAFRQAASMGLTLDKGQGNYFGSAGQNFTNKAAETWSSLLVQWTGGGGANPLHHRAQFMGGISDNIINGDTYQFEDNFNGAFQAFVNVMIRGQYLIKSRPAPDQASVITAFLPDPTGRFASILPAVVFPGGASRGFVIIRGLSQPHGWNGTHSAQSALVNNVPGVYIGPTRQVKVTIPPYDQVEGATVQAFVPVFTPISIGEPERITERKRGRPFGEPVGRRSRP